MSAVAPVAAAPGHASVVIRHQVRGCHSWSVNGGTFKASQSITLRHGGSLVVTNNDVMPHKLVLTSGPALRLTHPLIGHMGASTTVTLTRARRLPLHDEARRGLSRHDRHEDDRRRQRPKLTVVVD